MRSYARVCSLLVALAVGFAAPQGVRAEETLDALMSSWGALGAPREGESDRFAQVERALAEAERAEADGRDAHAARHRELAEALIHGLEMTRREALVRAQLQARRQALAEAQARLEVARARHAQAEADRLRTEEGTR